MKTSSRRLSTYPRHSIVPSEILPFHDDAAEKAANRASRNITDALNTSSSLPRAHLAQQLQQQHQQMITTTPPQPSLTEAELANLYSSAIKLSQENKINEKNTWSLNLIDHMKSLVSDQYQSTSKSNHSFQNTFDPDLSSSLFSSYVGNTNFQLAGCTLDAGVKIYCHRVDSVHSNAYKVLGGLASHDDEDEATGSNQDGGDDGKTGDTSLANHAGGMSDDDDLGGGKKKAAKNHGASTLEHNKDSITVKKMDLDFAVDPLFQKMSAAFDEGGAHGMLLNVLNTAPSGALIFDSDTVLSEAFHSSIDQDQNIHENHSWKDSPVDISGYQSLFHFDDQVQFCPKFRQFCETKLGSNPLSDSRKSLSIQDQSNVKKGGKNSMDEDEVDFDYSMDNYADLVDRDLSLIAQSKEAQLQRSWNFPGGEDDDEDDNGWTGPDDDEYEQHLLSPADSTITSGRAVSSSYTNDLIQAGVAFAVSDYTFFNASSLKGWAGANHWKFSKREIDGSLPGKDTKNANKKPRGKTAQLLDFTQPVSQIDFAEAFKPAKSKYSNILSKTLLERNYVKYTTLPEDCHYKLEDLRKLFLKPNTVILQKRVGAGNSTFTADDDDDELDTGFGMDNEFDDGDFVGKVEPAVWDKNRLELLPEPNKVEKVDIKYATTAKKVDVRKLKESIWSKITDKVTESKEQEDRENKNSSIISLKDIVDDLPRYVSAETLPDVSISYVFICLLHLANEKNLKIEDCETLTDLKISTPHD